MSATNIFPGLPLIESPLFDADDPGLDWTPGEREIARALARDGFVVFDFPDPDFEVRVARIKARLGPMYGVDLDDPDAIKSGDRRIQDAWQFDEDVKAIAANGRVLDLLGKLWGRSAFPFQTLNFPVGTQQALHSDSVHFSTVPERFMCGVWVAMEDITIEQGPLHYVPGSHRWPLMSNTLIGRRGWGQELASAQDPYGPAWAALIAAKGAGTATFLARKGQALIWCANLLHGGSPQLDPRRTRWSQVTHYFFDECMYYTPAFSDEPLGRLRLRQLVNIADGTARPNRYLGEDIPMPEIPGRKRKTRVQKWASAARKWLRG